MRLISVRTGTGEALGVVSGERWLPASALVDGGPATMDELLAGGRRSTRRAPRGRRDLRGRPDRVRRRAARGGRAARARPATRQGRRDRPQLPGARRGGAGRPAAGAARLREVAERRRRRRRRDPLGPGAHDAGRLRGRARRRHRDDRPARVGGRRAGPRPRLHLPQRRVGPGHPVRRRPVGPRQVARHVLPDGPGARHGRRDRRPAGPRDLVHGRRRGRPGVEHRDDVLRRRRDHQPLLAGVQPRARRRDRDRHARRRRRLPRSAAVPRGRRRS